MRIKYVSFYDVEEYIYENRIKYPSGVNKMDYICSVLNRLGISVDFISSSWTTNKKGFYPSRRVEIGKANRLFIGSSFGAFWYPLSFLPKIHSWIWLFFFLLTKTKRGETILVYHGVNQALPLLLAKKIKKLQFVLEVEEIFADLGDLAKWKTVLEMKMIRSADKYIFSSATLNEKINEQKKPFCIANGNYKVEEKTTSIFDDDKTHIVYAGTFAPEKGGALAAIYSAEFLPRNYHVHIIGFGTLEQIQSIQSIAKGVAEKSVASVTYDGLLEGEEYIKFLQKCHIGLSTQNPVGAYNDTSFPSKILSYMANGLRVVSVRIKAVETSAIGDFVYYYEGQKPEAIADAIVGIDSNTHYDSRKIIEELDDKFQRALESLF